VSGTEAKIKCRLSEIYKSIQGESTFAGLPCVFVRFAGCNLDCTYCDTRYAREARMEMEVAEVAAQVERWGCSWVELTGGEPLLQEAAVVELCQRLLATGKQVLVETNGSLDIQRLPSGVVRIVDVKCPDSGMSGRMLWDNLARLTPLDEVKFVISSRRDYLWARGMIRSWGLERYKVLLSAAYGRLEPGMLADWMLADGLSVRLQLQLHRYIWPAACRGV